MKADSWIEITDSRGQRLVFDLLAAGHTREVLGTVPFDILLGRSEAVAVAIDGDEVDHAPFQRKGIARFIADVRGGELLLKAP
ncbi:MAG TPA: DUF4115 domain-containing protein [Gammaproteobacteria bacterium]